MGEGPEVGTQGTWALGAFGSEAKPSTKSIPACRTLVGSEGQRAWGARSISSAEHSPDCCLRREAIFPTVAEEEETQHQTLWLKASSVQYQ